MKATVMLAKLSAYESVRQKSFYCNRLSSSLRTTKQTYQD